MLDKKSIIECLNSAGEEGRRLAVAGLADSPFNEVKGFLYVALGDESWRVRKESVNILIRSIADTGDVESVVDLLRSPDNAGLRNAAVEVLENLGGLCVDVLPRYVDDADHDVRKFIVDIMGSSGNEVFIAPLVRALDDSDVNVRIAAAENLGKLGSASAVAPLVNALSRDDLSMRFTVLEALGKIGRPVPMDVLVSLAADSILKKAIYECLGAIGAAEGVPLLIEGLNERVKTAREAAAVALARIRSHLAGTVGTESVDDMLARLKDSSSLMFLADSLAHADDTTAEAIIQLLGVAGHHRSAPALLRACKSDRLRRDAFQALRQLGDEGMALLVDSYDGMDEEEQAMCLYLCGELNYRGSTGLVRAALLDERPLLRRSAVMAAGMIGLSDLLDDLVVLLDDPDKEVSRAAVDSLTRMARFDRNALSEVANALAGSLVVAQRRQAVQLLGALADGDKLSLLIKDEDPLVRRSAVASIAGIKSEQYLDHLVKALVDEDTDVRIAAANGFGLIGGDRVLEPLLIALKDSEPWVQIAALKSLGRLGRVDVVDSIVELLASSSPVVQLTALETLDEIGGERVKAEIVAALNNPDEDVVKAALDILSRDGSDWIDEYRDRLLKHPHWEVRSSFISCMTQLLGPQSIPYLRDALARENDDLVKGQLVDILDRLQ